ncbi:MAG: hypothetical protein HYR71_08830 [Chloroflexi bacterium]|nr:hypothetical protein [Chloroflexota bacterium]
MQVAKTIHDSPKVAEYCLDLLRQARELAFGSDRAGELSKAEYFAEKVRTKLAHSDDPIPPEEVWHVRAVLAWNFIALAVSAALATLPWVFPKADIQVAGVALIRAEFVPLLTTLGWGGIGGVIGTLYNMPWFVQIREYDPAYNLDYIARPIKGLTAGGLVYLLYLTGMLTLNGVTIDQAGDKFIIPCFIAALSGFKQEYVFELFDKILQAVFRTPPPTPRQIDPGANKK